MLASPLTSFLDMYNLSLSYLKFKTHRHSFSYSLVYLFKLFLRLLYEWSEYLTRTTAQMFTPLIRFLLCNLVSRSFLVFQRYSFIKILFFFTYLIVFTSNIPKYLLVSFSPSILIFDVLLLPSSVIFRFSPLAWHIFSCFILYIYPDCTSSFPVLGFPIPFPFWQTVWGRLSILGDWSFLTI